MVRNTIHEAPSRAKRTAAPANLINGPFMRPPYHPPAQRRKRKTRSSWRRDSSPRRWPPTPAPCFPAVSRAICRANTPISSAWGDPGAKDSRRRISPRGGSSSLHGPTADAFQKHGIFSRHFHSVSGFSWIARGAHKTENPPEMLLMSRQRSQPALETTQPQRGDGVHPAGRRESEDSFLTSRTPSFSILLSMR